MDRPGTEAVWYQAEGSALPWPMQREPGGLSGTKHLSFGNAGGKMSQGGFYILMWDRSLVFKHIFWQDGDQVKIWDVWQSI